MSSVFFYNADIQFKLKRKRDLKHFVFFIFCREKKLNRSVNIVFCSDEFLLAINKEFLNHDFYTDIITFDSGDGIENFSELYISIDRIKENKKILSVSLHKELNRIIFHGILHLCGYKDKNKPDKKLMALKEDEYLKEFESFHVKQKVK